MTLHPTQTPEYWEELARNERLLAAKDRSSRWASVESIRVREANARDYEATAQRLRQSADSSKAAS